MSKKIIKKLSFAMLTTGMLSTAFATDAGGYFGLMVGQSNLHGQNQTFNVFNTPITLKASGRGVGARLFAGYNMNVYSALEGGFTYYFPMSYTLATPSTITIPNDVKTKAGSLDFSLKGMLPFWDTGFGIFGKFGFAYFYSLTTGTVNRVKIPKETDSGLRPLIGAGISYDMTPNWVADLSYTRVQFSSKVVQNPDLIAFGISYHLVDAMCGQFLC